VSLRPYQLVIAAPRNARPTSARKAAAAAPPKRPGPLTVACVVCGRRVPNPTGRRHTCSAACRSVLSRWRRTYNARSWPPNPTPGFCANCGRSITHRDPRSITCGDACRFARSRARRKQKKLAEATPSMEPPSDDRPCCPTCSSSDAALVWADPSLRSTPRIFACHCCRREFRLLVLPGRAPIHCGHPAPLPAHCPAKGCGRAPRDDIWSHWTQRNRDRAMHALPPRVERLIWSWR
jgi:predicted nucleic acid-binding Zn ribbon protein